MHDVSCAESSYAEASYAESCVASCAEVGDNEQTSVARAVSIKKRQLTDASGV